MLLDLHACLLISNALPVGYQSALTISVLNRCKQSEYKSAVHLLWLTASTTRLTTALKEQLDSLVGSGLLENLLDVLEDVQQCSEAARALLQCITKLATTAAPQHLQSLWEKQPNQAKLIAASCASAAAAGAAAAFLLLVAARGLDASQAMQQLLQGNRHSSGAAAAAGRPGLDARSFAAMAMKPLLGLIQLKLSSWRDAAPLLLLSLPQQQLWLLICSVINVAHEAAPTIPLCVLHSFFRSPAAMSAVQSTLLSNRPPAVQSAAVQMVSKLATLSATLASCCFQAVAPIIKDLLQPAASTGTNSSTTDQAEQAVQSAMERAVAAGKMWQLLLQRVSSKAMLEAELAKQLPYAAAAVASTVSSLAAGNRSLSRGGGNITSIMPCVSAFLPLASSVSCCARPLLPAEPQVTAALLLPHIESLFQVVVAAPTLLQTAANWRRHQPQPQLQNQQEASIEGTETVVMLALWILQSFISALPQADVQPAHTLQQQRHQEAGQHCQLQLCAPSKVIPAAACTTAPQDFCTHSSWAAVVTAVATLLDANVGSGSAAALNMQTAALQLMRSLLKAQALGHGAAGVLVQPVAAGFGTASAVPTVQVTGVPKTTATTAAALPGDEWRHLAAALAALLECSAAAGPMAPAIAKRQLVRVASQLAGDLAVLAPQELLKPASGISAPGSSSRGCRGAAGCNGSVGQVLAGCLRAVRAGLRGRKLERSSSGQELLEAVEDALTAIQLSC